MDIFLLKMDIDVKRSNGDNNRIAMGCPCKCEEIEDARIVDVSYSIFSFLLGHQPLGYTRVYMSMSSILHMWAFGDCVCLR